MAGCAWVQKDNRIMRKDAASSWSASKLGLGGHFGTSWRDARNFNNLKNYFKKSKIKLTIITILCYIK